MTYSPVGFSFVLLPTSREQINKLGQRLALGEPVSDDDLHLLEELVACHAQALELARPRLDGLAETVGTPPLHVTHRAKTTGTIVEKLRRERGMELARVQDLAGIRIVGGITFDWQDQLAAEIVRRFPADPRQPKIRDRRTEPSHGYRAVHVIVSLDGVSIEIQVRTIPQHLWADVMERIADHLGRQIRYGQPPTPPPGISQREAEAVVAGMMRVSERLAAVHLTTVDGRAFPLESFLREMRELISQEMSEGIDL
jgi:ppGpp synthetase/RelA/SpoT-type nucleotidyltranferase